MNKTQFEYTNGDLVSLATDQLPTIAAVAALIVALEYEKPGSAMWLLRQCALIDSNFTMKSSAKDPVHSVEAQQKAIQWMRDFDAQGFTLEDVHWEV